MVSQIKVNEIIKQSGSSITIGESGDTVNVPSGATLQQGGAAVASDYFSSTAFYAHMDSQQDLSQDTASKVTFSQERYDLGSNYDASNYKYVVPSTGYYRFDVACHIASASDSQLKTCYIMIRFTSGGSNTDFKPLYYDNEGSRQRRKPHTFGIVKSLTAGDEVTIYAYPNVTSGTPVVYYSGTIVENYFSGYRVS